MTTHSRSKSNGAVARSKFLPVAAILSSAILAIGLPGPASAQEAGENTMARCNQLFSLWSKHNSDGYAKPLEARMAVEDCQKGNYASGIATLKASLERARIAIPPAEAAVAETPAPASTLRPHGEKRHQTP
jgi:hypothetical protein